MRSRSNPVLDRFQPKPIRLTIPQLIARMGERNATVVLQDIADYGRSLSFSIIQNGAYQDYELVLDAELAPVYPNFVLVESN
jgi:hypothetical protein